MDIKIIRNIFSKTLVKDTGVYTILYVLEKIIPFLILPIIAQLISKEDMGNWMLFQSISGVLVPLLTLCFSMTVTIKYFKIPRNEFVIYLNQLFLYTFIILVSSLLIIFVFQNYIEVLIDFSFKWQIIMCILVFFEQFITIRTALWRMDRNFKPFGSFTISYTLFQNILSLLSVYVFNLGWEGLVYSRLISNFIYAFIAFLSLNKQKLIKLTTQINRNLLPDIFRLSFPLAIHRLGAWLGDTANRLIINFVIGKSATGSYGIAAIFSTIVIIVEDSFNRAYVPFLYKNLAKINDDIKLKLTRLNYICYLAIISVSIVVGLFGYFGVGLIYGKQYADTKNVILILVLSAALNGLYKLHVNYIYFTGKTFMVMRVTIVAGIFNCLLTFFFVKKIGIIGAAYSQLVTYFLIYILIFITANKLYPLPWLYFVKKK